jgi:glutamine amidotransferase
MHSSTISPALTPTLESSSIHPPLDIRQLSSPQTIRDPAKPQEQGNTKKKRRSLGGMENTYAPNQQQQQQQQQPSPIPDSPELRPSAYGDPMKIAQYFPELN